MLTEDILAQYTQLISKWRARREISFEELRQALAFKDAEGNRWEIDLYGQWLKYDRADAGEGIEAEPPPQLEPLDPELWMSLAPQKTEVALRPSMPPQEKPSVAPVPPPPEQPLEHKIAPELGPAESVKLPNRRRLLTFLVPVVALALLAICFVAGKSLIERTDRVMPTLPATQVAQATETLAANEPEPNTPLLTDIVEPSATFTAPSLPTSTPTCTSSSSPLPSPTYTASPRPTNTPVPTLTPAPTITPSVTPSQAPTRAPSPLPSSTDTPVTPTTPPSPPTTPSRLSGQIVFPLFDRIDRHINIYMADVSGANRRLLLENASQPGIDWSLRRLTYRSWQADARGLFVRDIKSTSPLNLKDGVWKVTTAFEAGRLTLSWDGEDVVYPSQESLDRVSRLYDVNKEVLRHAGQEVLGSAPAWLPNNRLVFNHCEGTACGLFVMHRNGTDLRALTNSPNDTNPHVSRDGKFVAFMSDRDSNMDIYVIPSAGGGVARLTDHPAHDGLPAWSHDGQWIAFLSNRTGQWAVWAMTRDGLQEQQLFAIQGAPDGCPPWIPDRECGTWTDERIVWIP